MFFDLASVRGKSFSGLDFVAELTPDRVEMVPELTRFAQHASRCSSNILLCRAVFSCLKRLRTYLRSTMGQQRLNDLALLYVHRNVKQELDKDSILDNLILETPRNLFALSSEI